MGLEQVACCFGDHRFALQHSPMGHSQTAPDWTPLDSHRLILSGGAGIRTPVRDKIDHSVYVRVPLIEVSSRWPMDSPLLDKSFLISPTT